jgi:hypothetical protein
MASSSFVSAMPITSAFAVALEEEQHYKNLKRIEEYNEKSPNGGYKYDFEFLYRKQNELTCKSRMGLVMFLLIVFIIVPVYLYISTRDEGLMDKRVH